MERNPINCFALLPLPKQIKPPFHNLIPFVWLGIASRIYYFDSDPDIQGQKGS